MMGWLVLFLAIAPGVVQLRGTQLITVPLEQDLLNGVVFLQTIRSASLPGLSLQVLSLIDLSLLARWNIRPRLMGVSGVANVSVWGQPENQLQVLVDPDRLRSHGVSLQQVIETSANAQFVSNLSLAGNLPGEEIEHPMSIVIVGGLITTTLLNLFVLPSLYLRYGKPTASRGSGTTAVVPTPA